MTGVQTCALPIYGGDMLRLNMAVPVTPRNSPEFSPLGLIDAAVRGLTVAPYNTSTTLEFIPNMDGFPNGRRLEDDVTRIELQAVSGVVLAAIGIWYDDFDGVNPVSSQLVNVLSYTTGIEANDKPFKTSFPYLALPHAGDGECGGALVESNGTPPEALIGIGTNSRFIASTLESHVFANNYPNPFSDATTVRFIVDFPTDVNISVFDRSGKLISTLVDQSYDAGNYEARFESANLPAGLYFVRITTNGGKDVQVLKVSKI